MRNTILQVQELANRQKSLIKWAGALVALTSFHMLLDPILHWS